MAAIDGKPVGDGMPGSLTTQPHPCRVSFAASSSGR